MWRRLGRRLLLERDHGLGEGAKREAVRRRPRPPRRRHRRGPTATPALGSRERHAPGVQRQLLIGNKRRAGAIEPIADDGEADVGEVAADLVHAPGLGPRLDERDVVANREHSQPGERSLTVFVDGLDRQRRLLTADPWQVGVVHPRQPGIYDEALPRRDALDDRRIAFVDQASSKRVGQDLLPKARRGHEGAAGRRLIEAVHGLGCTQELSRDVEERGPGDAAAADDGHAGWLIKESPMLAPRDESSRERWPV